MIEKTNYMIETINSIFVEIICMATVTKRTGVDKRNSLQGFYILFKML